MIKLFRAFALLATTVAILGGVACSQMRGSLLDEEDEGMGTGGATSNVSAEERLNEAKVELAELHGEIENLDGVLDQANAQRESFWEFGGSIHFDSQHECEKFLRDLEEGNLSYTRRGDTTYPVRPTKSLDCESYISLQEDSANAARTLRVLLDRSVGLEQEVRKLESEVQTQEKAKNAMEAERERMASRDKERVLALKEMGWDGDARIEGWDWIEWEGCELERVPFGSFVSIVTIRGPEGRITDIWIWDRDVC